MNLFVTCQPATKLHKLKLQKSGYLKICDHKIKDLEQQSAMAALAGKYNINDMPVCAQLKYHWNSVLQYCLELSKDAGNGQRFMETLEHEVVYTQHFWDLDRILTVAVDSRTHRLLSAYSPETHVTMYGGFKTLLIENITHAIDCTRSHV